MNLNLNMMNRVRNQNIIPFDVFYKSLQDKLIEKATNYAANSKKCMIQAKLDEIEKDF